MPLNVSQYTSDLSKAFKELTWDSCALGIADATSNFFMSGTVTTTVTGVITSIPPTSFAAVGKGSLTTSPGVASLKASMISAFKTPVWEAVAINVANAIIAFTPTCIANITQYIGPVVGTGISSSVVAAGGAALQSGLVPIFKQQVWEAAASQMASCVSAFVATIVVSTSDVGVIPLPWNGMGFGNIA